MKKNKIQFAFTDDIKIIGVSTTLVDYKLAWCLNDRLKLNLVRHGGIKSENVVYPFYYYHAGENYNTFNLVSLVQNGVSWIKIQPRIDFLLIIRDTIGKDKLNEMIRKIKQIKQINHAYVIIDVNKSKGIVEVIDTVEMHEMDVLKAIAERFDPRKRMEVLRRNFEKEKKDLLKEKQ